MPKAGEGERAPPGWISGEWSGRHNYTCRDCPRATLDRDKIPAMMRGCMRKGGPCATRFNEPDPEPEPEQDDAPTPEGVSDDE